MNMENEFARKKAWSKPELQELSAANTESGFLSAPAEYSIYYGVS